MPQQNTLNHPSAIDWQVENLRLTAFPSPAAPFLQEELTWWTDLVGEPPETSTHQPKRGVLQQKGPVEEGQLILTIQPDRINWLFSSVEEEQEAKDLPIIGPFARILDSFIPLMDKWFRLETCPSVIRLAFGAVLLHPVENKQAGYQQLTRYLPSIQLDPEGMFNFLYQINRPRDTISNIDALKINRLSKWSVTGYTLMSLAMRPNTFGLLSGQERFACRLELDINTSQYFEDEMTPEQLPEVFNELVKLVQLGGSLSVVTSSALLSLWSEKVHFFTP